MTNDGSTLRPIKQRSVVDRIIDRITDAILEGQFRPGERIPTEEQLATAFGVARNSVREAVKVLVTLGVLEIRRAEGTFVSCCAAQHAFSPALYGMIMQESGLHDLIEVRRLFEEGTMRCAMEKATEEDISRIGERLEQFIACLSLEPPDADAILACDIAFHRSIEEAAHNTLMLSIGEVIARLTIPSRKKTIIRCLEAQQHDFFAETHRMLTDIMVRREPDRIPDAISYHYSEWSKYRGE